MKRKSSVVTLCNSTANVISTRNNAGSFITPVTELKNKIIKKTSDVNPKSGHGAEVDFSKRRLV